MRVLRSVLPLLALGLVLAGCVKRDPSQAAPAQPTAASGSSGAAAASAVLGKAGPLVVLLRTDLGLGDGEFVREADAALTALAQQGVLRYQAVGALPKALEGTSGQEDIGLPVPKSDKPGEMTLTAAAGLFPLTPPCDVLVVSTGSFLPRTLDAIAQKQLTAKCVLLLDEEGLGAVPATTPVPLLRIRYDIKHAAFLAGVAVAQSSSLAHFGILYANDDPQGAEFARAAAAGAKYLSNGAWTEAVEVPVGPEGYIDADTFLASFQKLKDQGGPNFATDHYILDLGRSTPTILNALSKKPYSAYVLGAYANYCAVRPAYIVGCALKRPDKALSGLLGKLDAATFAAEPARTLAALADADGVIKAGIAINAVDFTDLSLYTRYRQDGSDIHAVVERNKALIKTGELTAKY